MDSRKFILQGKIPVPIEGSDAPLDSPEWEQAVRIWGTYMQDSSNRIVKQEDIGPYFVSTIFIGLDYNWGEGPPLLFETMIFDHSGKDRREALDYQERYPTWELALEGHREACEWVRNRLG